MAGVENPAESGELSGNAGSGHRGFDALDRATLWIERPVRKVAGSSRLNPLPHAGTISVFLLMVVVVSGLYVTLFFEFGREASYASVESIEEHALQRVVRALHRYSSAAMVLTTLVHSWRIFASRRFAGHPRRWRWVTGLVSLLLVWLAGVSGYWLIWDRRAQAVSEILIALSSVSGWTSGLAVTHLSETGEGSGSGLLLMIWFVHLGLTAVIGWFVYRHLRGSKLAWLPPRHWMLLMGGSLLFVSIILPVGMLQPADAERLVGEVPLDPFILFLLPPLLSEARWLVILGSTLFLTVLTVLPWLLDRKQDPIVEIEADRCTGCDLCVIDCPYDALSMVQRHPSGMPVDNPAQESANAAEGSPTDSQRYRHVSELIAEVDPSACVSCGICVASCAFGAMEMPGLLSRVSDDIAGRSVVVACERHVAGSKLGLTEDEQEGPDISRGGESIVPVVIAVRCAGALSPAGVQGFLDDGAIDVQLVGCPPHDCRYGIGNTLASERFSGDRAPRLPRKWIAAVSQDWVAPTDLLAAMTDPGSHSEAGGTGVDSGPVSTDHSKSSSSTSTMSQALLGAGLVIIASVVGVAFATRAPFSSDAGSAGLRVVIDHVDGQAIRSLAQGSDSAQDNGAGPIGAVGAVYGIRITVGDDEPIVISVSKNGDRSVGVLDQPIELGPTDIRLVLLTDDGDILIPVSQQALLAGERMVVIVDDVPRDPGAEEGERVFNSRAAGCTVCHATRSGGAKLVGPNLANVASVAGQRVPGLDAELYLRQSILLPDEYIVEGWDGGQMLQIYQDALSESELEDLLAYLLTLKSSSQDGSDEGDS